MERGGWTVHSRVSRIVTAALVAASGASLPALLLFLTVGSGEPVVPATLVGLVLVWTLLPAAMAWILDEALAGEVAVRDGELLIARRDLRLDVPAQAIARLRPWAVPLPGPGLSLETRSGRRNGLAARDPTPVLLALATDVPAAGDAGAHPTLLWAHARATLGPTRWYHRVGKFPLFGLGPALVLFNAHQHIAYGAFFGEWLLLGPQAWTRTLLVHWITVTVYLVLWAGGWRALAEVTSLAAAHVAPSHVARVRRAVEIGCALVYYGGVPLLLLLRFLS
jgi:hypothetical protein